MLGRELILASNGQSYVEGTTGYRALALEFIRDVVMLARNEQLAYLAIHNHAGTNTSASRRSTWRATSAGIQRSARSPANLWGQWCSRSKLPPATSGYPAEPAHHSVGSL